LFSYLGDALIHASFPILLIGAGLFHPLAALGPIANYVFLRFIGGDRENEQTQAERYEKEDPVKAVEFRQYREEKNSFWPNMRELGNKWSWVVLAAGVGGVLLENGVRSVLA
jgi:steroid 5-alpha reductase family enzyme